MTVSELIRDLQTMPPHLPVNILAPVCNVNDEDWEFIWNFDEENSIPADEARFEGAFVLIKGRA